MEWTMDEIEQDRKLKIPKDKTAENLTLEECLEIIEKMEKQQKDLQEKQQQNQLQLKNYQSKKSR